MPRIAATRRVAMVAFPGVQILDVTGPLEVFGCATRLLAYRSGGTPPPYEVEIIASRAGAPKRASISDCRIAKLSSNGAAVRKYLGA